MLNLALFGLTAKEWRAANPDFKGNMRDEASAEQLLGLFLAHAALRWCKPLKHAEWRITVL